MNLLISTSCLRTSLRHLWLSSIVSHRQDILPVNCHKLPSLLQQVETPQAISKASTFNKLGLLQQVLDWSEPDAIDMLTDEQMLSHLRLITFGRQSSTMQLGNCFSISMLTKRARQFLSWVANRIKFEFVSPVGPGHEQSLRCIVELQLVQQLSAKLLR